MALRRYPDHEDAWFGGVCEGIGREIGIESWMIRMAFFLLVFGLGVGFMTYILLWIFVPKR